MGKKYLCAFIVIIITFAVAIAYAFYITQQDTATRTEKIVDFSKKGDTIQYKPYGIIYIEANDDQSFIWKADIPYFINKQFLTNINHASGFPINASLSPDKTKLAYTTLPKNSRLTTPYLNGELWSYDISLKKQKKLAENVDYQITPCWSPDSSGVIYQSYSNQEGMKISFIRADKRENIELISDSTGSDLYPIGWSRDGKEFYYYRLSPAGNELWKVGFAPVTPPRFIITMNKGTVGRLKLSPSGALVVGSFSEMKTPLSEKIIIFSVDGKERRVVEQGAKKAYTPIWGPSDQDITYNIPYYEYPTNPLNYRYGGELTMFNLLTREKTSLAQSADWMDVPISWSPDGRWLIFRRYPGSHELHIRNYEGSYNEVLPSPNYTEFVDWLPEAKKGGR